jgi:hypothetical protein
VEVEAQSDEDGAATETANQVVAGDIDLPDKDNLRLIFRRMRDLVEVDE